MQFIHVKPNWISARLILTESLKYVYIYAATYNQIMLQDKSQEFRATIYTQYNTIYLLGHFRRVF